MTQSFSKLLDIIFSFPVRRPRASVSLMLVSLVIFLGFASRAQMIEDVDYFTVEDAPAVAYRERLKQIFGDDEFFVITFTPDKLFSAKELHTLKEITEKLELLPGVRKVRSLANVDETRGTESSFSVERFLSTIPEPGDVEEFNSLKERAVSSPLYVQNFVSSDGRTASIVVYPDRPENDPSFRRRLLGSVDEVLAPYRPDHEFYLAGWTVTNLGLGQYALQDILVFVPLCFVSLGLAVTMLFRNWRITFLALVNVSASVFVTFGLFGITGITVNNVTAICIPLIMCLSLADTMHIFAHLTKGRLRSAGSPETALMESLRTVAVPCLFTSINAGLGFLSLVPTKLTPISDFGVIASVGILFEFFYSFFLVPPLMLLLFPAEKIYFDDPEDGKRAVSRGLLITMRFIRHHTSAVLLSIVLLLALAGVFASRVWIDTNLLEYLKASTPLRQSLSYVEEHVGGVNSFEVVFYGPEKGSFKNPEFLQAIDNVESFLKQDSRVDSTLSFVTFLKEMNKSFHAEDPAYRVLPETEAAIAQYLLLYDSRDIEDYVDDSYQIARLSVRISEHGSSGQRAMLEQLANFITAEVPQELHVEVSGQAVNNVDVIDTLVNDQLQSLLTAGVVISISMALAFRSISLGLLSLIPNLIPIALNFGIMGLIGIPLNTGTVLIASVALGIACDDTTHFLTEYRRLRRRGVEVASAVEETFLHKGQAVVSTSIILTVGFGVLLFGSFVPVVHFGLLTAIIMLTGPTADMFFLPAFLIAVSRLRARWGI